jgi:hypothetical protein
VIAATAPSYSGRRNSPARRFVTSGNCRGSGTSQSKHRNLRPPVLTSIKRRGLPHLEQIGGGEFLGMGCSTGSGKLNSLSPMSAEEGAIMIQP